MNRETKKAKGSGTEAGVDYNAGDAVLLLGRL